MSGALHDLINWGPTGLIAWLFIITVVVFFHELGHFSVGRFFGVRVETFSIGFGPEIFGWTDRKGTRWKISWIPLGGYVKYWGDADATSRPDHDKVEEMSPEERSQSLLAKPVHQRALISAAGPFANFILAIVIYMVLFMVFGRVETPPMIGSVTHGGVAEVAGIKPGDVIHSINGTAITSYEQLLPIIATSPGEDLAITLDRGGSLLTIHAAPRLVRRENQLGYIENIPTLGITGSAKAKPRLVRYGPVGALNQSVRQTWGVISGTLKGLGQIITGRADASQLRGPVWTAGVAKRVAEMGLLALIELAAFMSVSIGLVNLFPIPILDGGHLLYYGCEAVLGRPLGERAQEVGFRFGLALVLGLLLFATWNDLTRSNHF